MFKYFFSSPKDESVFKLVQQEDNNNGRTNSKSKRPGQNRYRSIHSAMVRKEMEDSKIWCSKTMGVPRLQVGDPALFLKKNSKRPISLRPSTVPTNTKFCRDKACQSGENSKDACVENGIRSEDIAGQKSFFRACTTGKKPPIPHGTFDLASKVDKDYVKSNAMGIIQSNPKPVVPRYVDANQGTTKEWLNSGLDLQYSNRKTYARVPKYVLMRKDELISQQRKQADETQKDPPRVRKLEDEERQKMIEGLKKNWNEVFNLFQSMPLLIDTPGKIKRKTSLEVQLKRIEKDLQTLQRHDIIYVADIERSYYIPSVGQSKHKL